MNKLYCLMGPSGTGKSALATSTSFPYAKFHITRPARKDETDGVHSHFITKEQFKDMNSWACKTTFDNNHYGLHTMELGRLSYSPMVCITDVNNFNQLKEYFSKTFGHPSKVVGIYIDTPREQLIERMALQGRGGESIKNRIKLFADEEKRKEYCKYSIMNDGNFNDCLLALYETIIKDTFNI